MKSSSKKLGVGVGCAVGVFVPFVFWVGGFDFNTRGETAVMCAVITPMLAGLCGALAANLSELS